MRKGLVFFSLICAAALSTALGLAAIGSSPAEAGPCSRPDVQTC